MNHVALTSMVVNLPSWSTSAPDALRSCLAAGLLASLLAASHPTEASVVTLAKTFKNSTGVSTSVQSPVGETVVAITAPPGAAASAVSSLTSNYAKAEGRGTGQLGAGGWVATGASGSGKTEIDYVLFDPLLGRPLTPEEAESIRITFSVGLKSSMDVDPVSMSSASIEFGASLNSSVYQTYYNDVLVIFGPVPPPPGQLFFSDYSIYGDSNLFGEATSQVLLEHVDSTSGHLEFFTGCGAKNVAKCESEIGFGASYSAGSYVIAGLVLMINTNLGQQFIPISSGNSDGGGGGGGSVPEPDSLLLLAAAMIGLAGARRLR